MTGHMTLPFQKRFLRYSGANGTKPDVTAGTEKSLTKERDFGYLCFHGKASRESTL